VAHAGPKSKNNPAPKMLSFVFCHFMVNNTCITCSFYKALI